MLLWYAGLFGNLSLQTKSKYIDDNPNVHAVDKRAVSEERIFIFRPSFLKNNQFELRVINRCGHIARTLSMDCVVDFKAPVFDMCRSGDIRGLRDAYYSGSISLNVVNPLGMGLLHVSVCARLCSCYLIVDSMRRVAFKKTCVLGFSVWAWVLIVQVGWESV